MISNRVKSLRKKLNLSQTEFGKKLGLSRAVIVNIESNRVEPKSLLLQHICDIFKVNSDWLLNGVGSPFIDNTEDNLKADDILILFESLQPRYQDYVRKQIIQLLKLQKEEDASTSK